MRGNKSRISDFGDKSCMKKVFQLSALALLPASTNLDANHPLADTVSEETYSLVDNFVLDAPDVTPDFDDMDDSVSRTHITVDSFSLFGKLATRGDLQEYIDLLDGVVKTSISFNKNGSVTMTVYQAR
jgi:hypothetical protein